MGIKKAVDRLLCSSGSVFGQIGLWFLLALFVFLVLFLISSITKIVLFSFEDLILMFMNPGSFFPDSSRDEIDTLSKYWALMTGAAGFFVMSGLLIPCVNNIIARRVEKIQNGNISYYFKNHYVIIGYDKMLASIIAQLCDDDLGGKQKSCIVCQTALDVTEIKRKLEIELKKDHYRRLTFMSGACNSLHDIKKLHIKNAKRIVILGDNTAEAHDALNIECADIVASELPQANLGKIPECDILLNDHASYTILQKINMDNKWSERFYFRPFNFCETWAQKVIVHNKTEIVGNKTIDYMPLDGAAGIQFETDKYVHFVIMGMNKMGQALGAEAARILHFPNFIRDSNLKTRITFIDPNAEAEMNNFISHYPFLFELADYDFTDTAQPNSPNAALDKVKNRNLAFNDFLDIRFSFIKGNFNSPEIKNRIQDWALDASCIPAIAVCNDSDVTGMDTGLFLPQIVFKKEIPVFIQQKQLSNFFFEMANKENTYALYSNVRPFGMINECFNFREIEETERSAKCIMWVYNTFSKYRSAEDKGGCNLDFGTSLQKTKEESLAINEELNRKWQKLAVSKRWANIYNAFSAGVKRRSFVKKDIGLMAHVEHNRWNAERLIFGYRTPDKSEYEKINKNRELKEQYRDKEFIHYDLCPFNKLDYDAGGIKTDEYDIVISECLDKIYSHRN